MSWGEVELEPEVVDWFGSLTEEEQARVGFHVDRLAATGPLLDEPHTKQLDGKLRELRFYLGSRGDARHVLDRARARDRVVDGVHEGEAERATRGRTRQASNG